MKKQHSIVLLPVLLLLAVSCANNPSQIKIPGDAVRMTVAFSWEGVQACSHESPEIQVTNIPDGTTELIVKLKDISMPVSNHGGGKVVHDGSGRIPVGALNIGYNGPCPPEKRHTYEFSVMAVNAEGIIIGFGKERQSFPPKR